MKDLVTVEPPPALPPRSAAGRAMAEYLEIERELATARAAEDLAYNSHKALKAERELLEKRLRACADQVGLALNHLPRQSVLSAGDRSRS